MGSHKSPSRYDSSPDRERRRRDDSRDHERRSRRDDSRDHDRRRRRDDSRDYDHRRRRDDSRDHAHSRHRDDYEGSRRRDRSQERSRKSRRDDSYEEERRRERSTGKLAPAPPIVQSESSIPSADTLTHRHMGLDSMMHNHHQAQTIISASTTSILTNSSPNTVINATTTQVKRRKTSRFAPENERYSIPGIPVAIAGEMDEKQRKLYLTQLRIEEIGMKMRTGNLGVYDPNVERSPSPEPIYNSMGIRQNTRELRVRQKLEDERHKLIIEAKELNPEYKPPLDYRPTSNKIIDKVMIPQDVHPSINFIGLLIGPRGNTLKRLESESNTKIIIRGKGSLKEGKLRTQPLPGEDEPLHALVTASNSEDLRNGMALIESIIEDGLANPDGDNELRRMQLRELAQLNGTLIASEVSRCKNCGSSDHRHWECPQAKNITNITICDRCGGGGHIASDCIYDGERAQTAEEKSKLDSAYYELMNELGVKNEGIDAAGNAVFGGGDSEGRNIPSILALPKVVVSQLPWANAAGGFLGTNPNAAQLSLPSNVPAMSYGMHQQHHHPAMGGAMGFQPIRPTHMGPFAPLAEAFGLPQHAASYPSAAPPIWPNMSPATTNSGVPVSQLSNATTNEGIPVSELNKNSNNGQTPDN